MTPEEKEEAEKMTIVANEHVATAVEHTAEAVKETEEAAAQTTTAASEVKAAEVSWMRVLLHVGRQRV